MLIMGKVDFVRETTSYLAYVELELEKIEAAKEFLEFISGGAE